MSATSGIAVSPELSQEFSSAVGSKNIRFLKVSIRNESLVYDVLEPVGGPLEHDLPKLQEILEDNVPAYVLVRLDDPATEWLAIYYVPDTAKVRDKMLYASTRNSLVKSLGSSLFADSIFATSKSDITPEAYKSHKLHIAAPKPLSAREREMADIKAAEREAGGSNYDGSRARKSHVTKDVAMKWTQEAEDAVTKLGAGDGSGLVVISIDLSTETLVLGSDSDVSVNDLGSALPPSDPSYALFAWPHAHTTPPRREIVFIYSCPSSSSIKDRMVYSLDALAVFRHVGLLLSSSSSSIHPRKIETSDPKELNDTYLKDVLGLTSNRTADDTDETQTPVDAGEKKAFAKPKGPGRRR